MKPITFDANCYRIGGRPVYINSGEFHYFRVPKKDWRRRMRLFKAAGGNCLATYIPWILHEPTEGNVIFGGEDGMRDLEGFLKLAREMELYVVARPGPYQYSELKYDGLPTWLCDNYPALRAHDVHGKAFRNSSVSYLHPLFLEKVKTWFGHVCPIIERHLVSNGGAVALVQFDNEMGGIHWWISGHDYNADAMGIGKRGGLYPRFLRKRYRTIKELNRLYGTNFKSFENVRPIEPADTDKPPRIRQARDYLDFYYWTFGEYGKRLAQMIRSFGIDVPLVHNSPNPSSNAQFAELAEAVPQPFLLGSDHYYNLGPDWPQNNPTPQYAIQVFHSCEMLRLMGFPPTVWELPGGSCSDWPPTLPDDALACYMANLALGMKAHNYYIFTGGPNPPKLGTTSDIYDFNASIGANGEIRPLYKAQEGFARVLATYPWLAEAEREGDCRFTMDFEHSRSEKYWRSRGEFLINSKDAWDFVKRGALTSAFCGSLSPIMCNPDLDDWSRDMSTPVVITSSAAMSAAIQKRIVRFLKAGGRALLMPVIPTVDEKLEPCTILGDFLGKPSLRKNVAQSVRLNICGVNNVFNTGDVFFTEKLPGGAVMLGEDELTHGVIAWKKDFTLGGLVVFLGFRWNHAVREHSRMLRGLLNELGLKRRVICSNPNVWTSLRSAGGKSALFLMNLHSSRQDAQVVCPANRETAGKPITHHLAPMSVKIVHVGG